MHESGAAATGRTGGSRLRPRELAMLACLLGVLAVETGRCVKQAGADHTPVTGASSALALRIPVGEVPPGIDPGVNEVPKALLAPRLLDDRAELARFIDAFPRDLYTVVRVDQIGRFYLDSQPDVIKDVLRSGSVWEPEQIRHMIYHVSPGTTVVDAGAHIGTHTVTLSRLVGPAGRVYAFEPQRKIYRELVHNLELNDATNVIPLRIALGDQAAIVEMNPATGANEGGVSIGAGGDRAELRTLDSFDLRNVSFLKIDVEGWEDGVLDGAAALLRQQRPVLLVEIQGGGRDFDRANPEQRARIVHTIQKMEAFGYHVRRVTRSDYLAVPRGSRANPPAGADTGADGGPARP